MVAAGLEAAVLVVVLVAVFAVVLGAAFEAGALAAGLEAAVVFLDFSDMVISKVIEAL